MQKTGLNKAKEKIKEGFKRQENLNRMGEVEPKKYWVILIFIYNSYLVEMLSSMKLAPTTLMGKEEAKKIKTIIQSLIDKPESYDFQAPVDWKSNIKLK